MIQYNELEQEILKMLGESKTMVLATSSGNRVTARAMSCIFRGLKILFQMSTLSTKGQQIMDNHQVALCFSNLQVEGTATILGHPYEVDYFKENYSRLHAGSFKTYSGKTSNRVVEVTPSVMTLWKYDQEGKPFSDILDVAKRQAVREYYDTTL